MPDATDICRRPDGSIDTGYYVAAGRIRHGEAVRRQCKAWLAWWLSRRREVGDSPTAE